MLLTADIGNTNIVLALLDHGDRVVSQRRIPSGEVLPLAAYEDAVRQMLAGHDAPEGAVIGSVVPRLTEETARAIRSVTGLEALVVGPTTPAGLDIAIEQPETLGVDLLAADAAAAAEYPLPVVVFDFGTATTVTFTVVRDTAAPEAPVIAQGGDGKVTLTAAEEHVTLYYSYDGTEWVLYTGPFAPTAAKVYAKAVDQAGNESAVSQLAVAVAASQPVKTGDAAPLAVYAALLLTAAAALTAMPVLRRRRVR